ncbi:MAG: DNA methyltransferase [Gemmatimonadales bacterium]
MASSVAHFLVQCLFCMFAEDEALLPAGIFTDLLAHARGDTGKAARRIAKLFARHAAARRRIRRPRHRPGSTAASSSAIDIPRARPPPTSPRCTAPPPTWTGAPSTRPSSAPCSSAASTPPRAPRSAPTTPTPSTIAKLIDPLIREPLARRMGSGQGRNRRAKAEEGARAAYQGFLLRLDRFRVLDPACGSGNFLYLALKAAARRREARPRRRPGTRPAAPNWSCMTGPHNILGLEINEFAAELARVTVWIGDIQWCRRNGYPHAVNPILKPLDGIEHRDALPQRRTAAKPNGRPPTSSSATRLSSATRSCAANSATTTSKPCARPTTAASPAAPTSSPTGSRRRARRSRPAKLQGAGLVATNSIRGGANRKVLERIVEHDAHLRSVERRSMGQRRRRRARFARWIWAVFPVDRSSRLDGAEVAVDSCRLDARRWRRTLQRPSSLPENAGVCLHGHHKSRPVRRPGRTST